MSSPPRIRSATINRDTNETNIQLALNVDGGAVSSLEELTVNGESKEHASQTSKSQQISVDTGIGFLDHMLHALAKHSGWSLRLRTRGDLHIDDHHTAEDTFIALGQVYWLRNLGFLTSILTCTTLGSQSSPSNDHRPCPLRLRLLPPRRSPLASCRRSLKSPLLHHRTRPSAREAR